MIPFNQEGLMMANARWMILLVCLIVAPSSRAEDGTMPPGGVLLTPAPKQIRWTDDKLQIGPFPTIRVTSAELAQVGRVLCEEMRRLYGLRPNIVVVTAQSAEAKVTPKNGETECEELEVPSKHDELEDGVIELVMSDSAEGTQQVRELSPWVKWPPPRNPEEGYILTVSREKATVLAATPQGCWYGCLTLLQLMQAVSKEKESTAGEHIETSTNSEANCQGNNEGLGGKMGSSAGMWLPGVCICDWPQLRFRGVHLCIFPNTELAAIRQAILWAARFKCNTVVIEPWASLKSSRHPEIAYTHAYSPEQIRPLIRLGQALHLDMVPMLNSWGHASGMRSRSGEHVVLDRFPQYRSLFEADGWSFRLANPEVYSHLFDRYEELLELFGDVRYFHIGMDEAWGHLGAVKLDLPPEKQPHELAAEHLLKLHQYFADRKIQVLMWHDMLVRKGDPEVGGAGPAGSIPPYNTHLALEKLPRDVIIAAWNYDVVGDWSIPRYFQKKGFRVVVCPWKSRRNTISLVNQAKELDLLGVLATTWDSLDVSLPSVAQAAVLAWEEPDSDLLRIPFDHWLAELRRLPICNLPSLETTLEPIQR